MTHPAPPLSDENRLPDDDDVILLTDEIPSVDNPVMTEVCQLADRCDPPEASEWAGSAAEKPAFFDLTDAIEVSDFKTELPPDFSISEDELLNYDDTKTSPPSEAIAGEKDKPPFAARTTVLPDVEYQPDDLQRLIDEVVHDSHVPPGDFSGISPEISAPADAPAVKDDLTSLSQDQIDAAMDRVIRSLYAERIESILEDVITKKVNLEFENMKSILMDYLRSGKTVPTNPS